jgi:PUA domain protein
VKKKEGLITSFNSVPHMLPKMQVDEGAIKYILRGADVMCPGLTHPTGSHMDDVEVGKAVAIKAEGKEHILGIGITLLSTNDM